MPYIVGVDDAIIMSLYANEYMQLGEGADDEDVELETQGYEWDKKHCDISKQEFIDAINKEIQNFRLLVSAKDERRVKARDGSHVPFGISIGNKRTEGYRKAHEYLSL